jgi:hypothetical protein
MHEVLASVGVRIFQLLDITGALDTNAGYNVARHMLLHVLGRKGHER